MDTFITPEQVAKLAMVSQPVLAQRRYKGLPPRYYKPTPKTVLYKESEVLAWINSSVSSGLGGWRAGDE